MRNTILSAALLALFFASCATDTKSPEEGTATETSAATPAAEKPAIANTKDPVCGMPITATDATAYVDHDGKKIGFCSEGCADEFKKDPAQYASKLN